MSQTVKSEISDRTSAESKTSTDEPLSRCTGSRPQVRVSLGKRVKGVMKGIANAFSLGIAVLPALTCWMESRFFDRNELFTFWGQLFALVPGLPGKYVRRGFYYLTLQSCSLNCDIGFLSSFNDRRAEVGRRVYIGSNVCIGMASLGDGCLIGNRVSIMNGGNQHTIGPDGRMTPFDRSTILRVWIGEETWIGEGAIVMANLGRRVIVATGSVVPKPIPDGYVVGGVPASLIRKTSLDQC